MRYARNNLHTDVLIIGGGISGCLAAIHAAKEGASCMVLEKSNTKRSGNAGFRNRSSFQLYSTPSS